MICTLPEFSTRAQAAFQVLNLRCNAITGRRLENVTQGPLGSALRTRTLVLPVDANGDFPVAEALSNKILIWDAWSPPPSTGDSAPSRFQSQRQSSSWSGQLLGSTSSSLAWPLVLKRANSLFQDDEGRSANALFHLLQGPDADDVRKIRRVCCCRRIRIRIKTLMWEHYGTCGKRWATAVLELLSSGLLLGVILLVEKISTYYTVGSPHGREKDNW